MLRKQDAYGNVTYEGYTIDVLKKIAAKLHFNYEIKEIEDNSYGNVRPDGTWDGLIGELASGVSATAIFSSTH